MSVAAYQIVYIESGETRLYGELVQHMEDRQTCSVRPLSLRLVATPAPEYLDVRNGPDIICADHVVHRSSGAGYGMAGRADYPVYDQG